MTELMMSELNGLYQHVVSAEAVSDVLRLLLVSAGPRGQNSVSLVWASTPRRRSILALEGLGKEVWEGIDPVKYVGGLRDEWNNC